MSLKSIVWVMLAILLCSTATLHAMDIGIMAPTDQKFRAEVYYENYKRDIKQDVGIFGGSTVITQKEDRVLARFSFAPQRFWGISLEAGGTDSDGSEGIAPIFGAGAHVVVLDQGAFYASLFGKITWVTGVEYREREEVRFDSEYVVGTYKRDEDYLEYAVGLQVGHKWTPCAWAEVTSYAGAMANFIKETTSDDRIYMEFSSAGDEQPYTYSKRDSKLDMEEEHIFQAFAGLATTITPYNIGVRVEGRFHDRTSISGSLFWNF
ncbi:MAG: hypothetical protein RBR43_05460 [Desulfuromonadaceae bacterium]|nr:hypothetical protein [Desulfuromonas sp.]MDY0185307.1 hypothetical protein [Desulfuromonadaceae bacterium]